MISYKSLKFDVHMYLHSCKSKRNLLHPCFTSTVSISVSEDVMQSLHLITLHTAVVLLNKHFPTRTTVCVRS